MEPQDQLVSFDVTNLLPHVPIDVALKVIEERLAADGSLGERAKIPAPQLVELTKLCVNTTYFRFLDTFYEQTELRGSHGVPPLTNCCQSIHQASGAGCPTDNHATPKALAPVRYTH